MVSVPPPGCIVAEAVPARSMLAVVPVPPVISALAEAVIAAPCGTLIIGTAAVSPALKFILNGVPSIVTVTWYPVLLTAAPLCVSV